MEHILFLDFDGVLITPRSTLIAGKNVVGRCEPMAVDPLAVDAVRRCCEAGARIVVSSSWRNLEQNCRAILSKCDLVPYLHADWRTRKDIYTEADYRGLQIGDWLDEHPTVRSYRILDDDTNIMPAQKPFFVRCDRYDGLGYDGMRNLLAWVGIQSTARG